MLTVQSVSFNHVSVVTLIPILILLCGCTFNSIFGVNTFVVLLMIYTYLLSSLQGAFTEQHFDQDLNFLATEEDPVTKRVS